MASSSPKGSPDPPKDSAILESPDEVLSTLHKDGTRRWLYPTPSKGRLTTLRLIVGWGLIALFVALPLIPIGGKPAILLDVVAREFTFFGLTLYATDTLLLMLFMLMSLGGVVFATALLGRAWCGWGCPQTVYLEFVYRPIERLIEGSESARKKRDALATEASLDKAWRKAAKHLIYLIISLMLAHVFVAYFVGWSALSSWMLGSPREHWGIFVLMAGMTAMIMLDFAWFREQMCTIVCPYARLQSALLDEDSLIVSYDPARGEPRGRRSRQQRKDEVGGVRLSLGDCVDCYACVRTCPTGIDIRDGLQMECIGCTQCVDACDQVMDKLHKPLGLILYTSENKLKGRPSRFIRPRTVLYGSLLLLLSTAFALVLFGRQPIDLHMTRSAGAPFVVLPDGRIANRARLRLQNRTGSDAALKLEALLPEGTELKPVGPPPPSLAPGQMIHLDTWIVTPASAFVGGSAPGRFRVRLGPELHQDADFNLLGPSPR